MSKTKLGISVGLLGAAIYFSGLFGGYLATFILVGYALLAEDNAWLRRTAVKATALMFGFSILSALIGLIPGAIGFINNIFNIFNGHFSIDIISKIVSVLNSGLGIVETVLFLILGLKSFTQGTIVIPVIDGFINKHIN